jgi:hypothetical protein
VIVAEVAETTPSEDTVNVAVVAPARTVTLAGTVATAVLEEDSVTGVPATGAMPVKVTVAVEVAPPMTVAGASATLEAAGCVTVRVAVFGTAA